MTTENGNDKKPEVIVKKDAQPSTSSPDKRQETPMVEPTHQTAKPHQDTTKQYQEGSKPKVETVKEPMPADKKSV